MTLFLSVTLLMCLALGAFCLFICDEAPEALFGVVLAGMLFAGVMNQADMNEESVELKESYAQSQQDFRKLADKYRTTSSDLTMIQTMVKAKDNVIESINTDLTKTRVALSVSRTETTMANDKVTAMEEAVNEAQDLALEAQFKADQAEADLHDAALIADAKVAQANSLADAYKEQATTANAKLDAIRGIL